MPLPCRLCHHPPTWLICLHWVTITRSSLKCLDPAIKSALLGFRKVSFPQMLCLILKKLWDHCSETSELNQVMTPQWICSLDKALCFPGSPGYVHIWHQFWILLYRVGVGVGRYSKENRASCPFWLLGQQLWDRDSLFLVFRSGCPGRVCH